jgi:hypothetical protein
MISNPKPANASPGVAAVDSRTASFPALMHRGTERLAELQRATLDLIGLQTADINTTLRESIKSAELPDAWFLEFTGQAVAGWVAAQKDVLERTVEQINQAIEESERCGSNAMKSLPRLSEFVQKGAERAVGAQKAVLDFAERRNTAASEVIEKQANGASGPLADATQSIAKGMSTLIDMNREFLDAASKLTKEAAAVK